MAHVVYWSMAAARMGPQSPADVRALLRHMSGLDEGDVVSAHLEELIEAFVYDTGCPGAFSVLSDKWLRTAKCVLEQHMRALDGWAGLGAMTRNADPGESCSPHLPGRRLAACGSAYDWARWAREIEAVAFGPELPEPARLAPFPEIFDFELREHVSAGVADALAPHMPPEDLLLARFALAARIYLHFAVEEPRGTGSSWVGLVAAQAALGLPLPLPLCMDPDDHWRCVRECCAAAGGPSDCAPLAARWLEDAAAVFGALGAAAGPRPRGGNDDAI